MLDLLPTLNFLIRNRKEINVMHMTLKCLLWCKLKIIKLPETRIIIGNLKDTLQQACMWMLG